jgi:transketolase
MMDERSKHLRRLIVRALEGGDRGHVGASMSLVEIMRVLYDDVARRDDRIILSKGHGCLAQYALLADKGVLELADLDSFCRFDGRLGGHPTYPGIPGIAATTGALGHGLAIGVGLALARPARVFVVLGDGELGEGSVWEAALHAGKHELGNLVAIIDANGMQSAGLTREVSDLEPIGDKFRAFGWFCHAHAVDGHDVAALRRAMVSKKYYPLAIVARTIKGKGLPFAENNPAWHHKNSFTPREIAMIKEALA